MRGKYYKKELHQAIKDLYFKHFQHLDLKDTFIKGCFTIHIVNIIKNDWVNYDEPTIYHKKMINMLQDFDGIELKTYVVRSDLLKQKLKKLIRSDEIVSDKIFDTDNAVLQEIIEILKSQNGESYLVGGSTRDILNNMEPKDFDFATTIEYKRLIEIFSKYGFETIETGKQFLVLNIKKNNQIFEICNLRKDGTYIDGRRPDSCSIGNILEDAYRRDFTINAIYFDLKKELVIDPTGQGLKDLQSNILRFIGIPTDRLNEDYLRVFRAYRFMNKGFVPTSDTLQQVRRSFGIAIKTVSSERIKNEIEKMVQLN